MSVSINGTNGLTFSDGTSQNTSPFTGGLGFRNRIINGDFRIDQRNAGASVTPATDNTYTLDRWTAKLSQSSKYSVQQSSTAPAGFKNSLLVTSLSAYTVGSGELFFLKQVIEGLNIADLGWGTADAQPVTLSFKVRSSLTGTFGGALWNSDGSRSYPFSYTISAANTYETKTITIAGDTGGTWLTTNGAGLNVGFSLGVGSTYSGTAGAWAGAFYASATGATSVVGTNGATFYITGVQLEKGSTATSFDYRPYGTELALCQRYFQRFGNGTSGQALTPLGSGTEFYFPMPVQMRATPTPSYANAALIDTVNPAITVTGITTLRGSTTHLGFYVTASGTTAYRPYYMIVNSTGGYLDAAAEL